MAKIASYILPIEDVRNMTELARKVSAVCVVVRAGFDPITEEVRYIAFSDLFADNPANYPLPKVEWKLDNGELSFK